ncbi:helix-turn-helix transcriptional regulator [Streptomyces sp. MZ04]|uniref:helix-turn-helix domain-containing protein n=1 Tax=Streptomyces sp. MZ04 TaxID=2559236 RepID=UPI00107EB2ED|nr:helix-turn-helix transcriptional regulator [Streptomyces sp. MZ04]TGA93719.1 XRE family transcriptional regulator [Streptomyces sp. MZ04]
MDGAGDFAELLRELKGRSGLSYGVLAKRLHVSTSTLHRYCNGDAVPTSFATVEKLARLCDASAEELVEVHRRWILADAGRGKRGSADPGGPVAGGAPSPGVAADVEQAAARPGGRRRRAVALAAVAVAVVLGSTALALNGVPGKGDGDGDGGKRNGAATAGGGPSGSASASPSKGAEHAPEGKEKERSASASPSEGRKGGAPGGSGAKSPSPQGEERGGDLGVPLTTRTRPYVYESPCSQNFLVDRKPNQVPKPPVEQDAPGWAADLGAVASGEQFIEVTVQGMGKETVVLQGLDVRVQSTASPLDWNNYEMGVGCGGGVETKSFGIDLDDGAPRAAPKAGQRDFPYKVSESDPEVFYIKANTEAHDVRWYLELEWSSGHRHGVLRIDDQGKPFRTSGREGRPTYGWPNGGSQWIAPLDG